MKTLYMTRDILLLLNEIISTDKLKTLEEDITNLFINHDILEDRILKNRKKLTRKDVSVIKRIINKQINYDIFPITREKPSMNKLVTILNEIKNLNTRQDILYLILSTLRKEYETLKWSNLRGNHHPIIS